MPSYRENDTLAQQMHDLLELGIYTTKTDIIEEAVSQLHRFHFPDKHPDPPHVIGWDDFILSQPAVCTDTGREMQTGETVWRELWSDGRPGQIFSREALEADGIL